MKLSFVQVPAYDMGSFTLFLSYYFSFVYPVSFKQPERHLQIPARRTISPWLGEWGSALHHSSTVIPATALCCQEMLLINARMVPHDNSLLLV